MAAREWDRHAGLLSLRGIKAAPQLVTGFQPTQLSGLRTSRALGVS